MEEFLLDLEDGVADTKEDTYRLALESAYRWTWNEVLSDREIIKAVRKVLKTALDGV